MVFFDDTKELTDDVIDDWSVRAVAAYRSAAGRRADNTLKLQLPLEELLLRFQDRYGTEEPCRIRGMKGIGGICFEISHHGMPGNPLRIDPEISMSYDLLAKMDIYPRYVYRESRGLNVVTLPVSVKQRKNAMLLGIISGALLAILLRLISGFLPAGVKEEALLPVITAFFDKFSRVFSALATPFVFLAVVLGISGIGNLGLIGRIGGRLIKRMLGDYGIAALILVILGLPLGLVSLRQVSGAKMSSMIS